MTRFKILICSTLLFGATAAAQAPAGRDIHARLVPSCAWVFAGREGRGTGWIVDAERRWVVTCFHVVGDARAVDVVFPDWTDGKLLTDRDAVIADFARRKLSGRVVKRDAGRDLALIEMDSLPATARSLPLAEAPAAPGDSAHTVGNRRDIDPLWAFASGPVRQRYLSVEGYPWRTERLARDCRLLALQLPINEGDSGGPVVNDRGELIGVTAAVLWPAQRAAAAIDVAEVRAFLGGAFAKVPPPAPPGALYARLVRATAWVQSPSATSRASALVIDAERRLLLTTARTVGPHERVELIFPRFQDGRPIVEPGAYRDAPRVRAAVLARDTRRNLALLEADSLPARTAALRLAGESARPGDALHAIANPNGIDALWLYTAATVRQAARIQLSVSKEDGVAAALVLQAPGNAGDGGGPIVNGDGELVAVAGGKDGPEQQVSYAVDLTEVKALLQEQRPLWQPQSADEFHRRGARRLRLRQLDRAAADFAEALRLAAGHEATLLDLPLLYRLRGEPEQALNAVQQGLKSIPPGHTAVLLARRAEIELDRDRLDAALKDCDAAVRIDGKCALARAVRAETWRRKKDLARALADADEAVWLNTNLAPAYLARGRIQGDRRDWDRAVTDLTRAIELDPFDPAPLLERARAFEEKTPPEPDRARRDRAAAKQLN